MEGLQETRTVPRFNSRYAPPESNTPPLDEETLDMWKVMSHDLRGSLISIMATLKLLHCGYYGRMDESVRGQVKEVLARVSQLISLSEECLGEVLSAEGHSDVNQEVLDLRKDVIDPVLGELSSEIKAHRIQIENCFERVQGRRIPITANRIWLKTIFRNLLQNAIRYGDSGGTIAFGFKIRGSTYQLNVYNSGNPIPEVRRETLFTQTGPVRDRDYPGADGMGMGLYLIKKIIQKLGGTIWYEAKDHGSNFVWTLPIEAH